MLVQASRLALRLRRARVLACLRMAHELPFARHGVRPADRMVASMLAIANEEKIALGKLAASKTENRQIRDFVAQMARDHGEFGATAAVEIRQSIDQPDPRQIVQQREAQQNREPEESGREHQPIQPALQ